MTGAQKAGVGSDEDQMGKEPTGWTCPFNPSHDPMPSSTCDVLCSVLSPSTVIGDPVLRECEDQLLPGHFLALPTLQLLFLPLLTSPGPAGPTPPVQMSVQREIWPGGHTS